MIFQPDPNLYFYSLNNTSNDIRWSLDLRWQRADKPVGFYGIKEGILMRSSTEPDLVVDWAGFESVDRQTADKLTDVEEKVCDKLFTCGLNYGRCM